MAFIIELSLFYIIKFILNLKMRNKNERKMIANTNIKQMLN